MTQQINSPTFISLINAYSIHPRPDPPDPIPDPMQAQALREGFGLRVLLEFDMGAAGTLRVTWNEITPGNAPGRFEPGFLRISELSNFADFGQVPDTVIRLANQEVLFDGKRQSLLRIHQDYNLEDREVLVLFWMEGTPYDDAAIVSYLWTRSPIQWNETTLEIRAVGIQRKIDDRLGKLVDVADLPNVRDADVGKIFPIVLGQAKKVLGIKAKEAPKTLLEGFIDDNDTTLSGLDFSKFSSSGSVLKPRASSRRSSSSQEASLSR